MSAAGAGFGAGVSNTTPVVTPRTDSDIQTRDALNNNAIAANAASPVAVSAWNTAVDPITGQSGVPSPFGGQSTDWELQSDHGGESWYINNKTGEHILVDSTSGKVILRQTADEAKQAEENLGIKGAARQLTGAVTPNGATNPVDLFDAAKDKLAGGGAGGALGLPTDATAAIQQAIAQQNALVAQNTANLQNYQNVSAPTVAQPGQINAANAAVLDPIQAAIAQAQAAQAAQQSPAVLAQQQAAIQAQQVQAAQIAQASQAQAGLIGNTRVGPVTTANAAQLDLAQQAQMRAAQQGLIGGLQGAIAGTEPSVADIMLRNATDRNVANQYALAQAANGMNTGMAQRTAMINAAEMNQNAIMQQALLRAQEVQAARGQLGGVLDSARGADIGIATNQAGLTQQANLANAAAANTSTLTQAQINAQRAQEQAKLVTGASQFNAGAANTMATEQAQLAQQAALANQQTGLGAATTNATLAQQIALANAGAQNTVNQANAQNQQAANLQNAQLGTQANIANAGNQTQAATSSAQLANAVNLANANNQSQANVTQAQLGTQAAIASANNQVSTNALNQKAQQDLAQNQIAAAGQSGQTSVGYGDVYAKLADAEAKRQAALIGGAAAAGAALISDPTEKTGLRSAEAEIAAWTSTLEPSTFRYKDGARLGAAPGQRFGITTEDLKKTKVGRSLVRKLDDGTESVDVGQSVGAILATLSAMNRRIDRVEAR